MAWAHHRGLVVYLITPWTGSDVYLGRTSDLDRRLREHARSLGIYNGNRYDFDELELWNFPTRALAHAFEEAGHAILGGRRNRDGKGWYFHLDGGDELDAVRQRLNRMAGAMRPPDEEDEEDEE